MYNTLYRSISAIVALIIRKVVQCFVKHKIMCSFIAKRNDFLLRQIRTIAVIHDVVPTVIYTINKNTNMFLCYSFRFVCHRSANGRSCFMFNIFPIVIAVWQCYCYRGFNANWIQFVTINHRIYNNCVILFDLIYNVNR